MINYFLKSFLSSGCKYYRSDYRYKGKANFGFKDKLEFTYCEDKLKEYMGEENYKKSKTLYGYECLLCLQGQKLY
ncbi:hypothetical protein [Campylobacter taeniopygiae]|uniref:hypothetical protein n=1 Tax=Campylobacter taeniopygiae TaxID=2510188 RepID=UPI003D6BE937